MLFQKNIGNRPGFCQCRQSYDESNCRPLSPSNPGAIIGGMNIQVGNYLYHSDISVRGLPTGEMMFLKIRKQRDDA